MSSISGRVSPRIRWSCAKSKYYDTRPREMPSRTILTSLLIRPMDPDKQRVAGIWGSRGAPGAVTNLNQSPSPALAWRWRLLRRWPHFLLSGCGLVHTPRTRIGSRACEGPWLDQHISDANAGSGPTTNYNRSISKVKRHRKAKKPASTRAESLLVAYLNNKVVL